MKGSRLWASIALLFLMTFYCLWVLNTLGDYRLATDEINNRNYGRFVLNSFTPEKLISGDTYSPPGKPSGSEPDIKNYHTGLYVLVAELGSRLLTNVLSSEVERLHLVNMVFGAASLLVVFMLGNRCGGATVGLLATLFLALTGRFLGEVPINPKDPPFATAFTLAVFALICYSERPKSELRQAGLGIAIAIAAAIRPVGMILLLPTTVVLLDLLRSRTIVVRQALSLFVIGFISLAVMLFLSWPWLRIDPIHNLVRTMAIVSKYPGSPEVPYHGQIYPGFDLPWHYFPTWLIGTIALPGLIGFGLLCVQHQRLVEQRTLQVLLITLALVVGVILFDQPAMYDGIRHSLFLFPSLYVLGAAGIVGVSSWGFTTRFTTILLIVTWSVYSLVRLWQWHPYYYCELNPIGRSLLSTTAATAFYDHWQQSAGEGLEWVDEQYDELSEALDENLLVVRMRVYLTSSERFPNLSNGDRIRVLAHDDPQKAHLIISTNTNGYCDKALRSAKLFDVTRLGYTLACVLLTNEQSEVFNATSIL